MSYQNIYDIVSILIDLNYIKLSVNLEFEFTKTDLTHLIVEDIVEHYNNKTSLFDKDEYTINLLRDVKRLLNMLIV